MTNRVPRKITTLSREEHAWRAWNSFGKEHHLSAIQPHEYWGRGSSAIIKFVISMVICGREIAAPVKLRIILGENDSQRLILPDGMPETLIKLIQEIKRQCGVDGDFRLQFMDVEFGNEFTNLVSMSDIQDKSSIKVIFNSVAPSQPGGTPPPPYSAAATSATMTPHPFHLLVAHLIQTYCLLLSPPPRDPLLGPLFFPCPGLLMILSYSWTGPMLLLKKLELC
ncbi:hypothetical protein PFLUV_G00238210 [Perca fluviatilis]|uniref:PB1 domain-containing protein n=1 Tax=Perca fluviatilis TaxID=8168 RepID=A0A6A5EH49_PERFL|nr:uncharacterized protein LOC120548640 isoform X3 [Perca fluviatilis]XP_039640924.1 uncharacterized protein LOC120548640 isoform X3 [Perca fluviatilis]XP_039640925.1 uncharacterized protein LOC120548640 isoform X3 [Perca fluviatilis]KAF1375303.1 hypothetical protein PFLUV_G00238210 [Perca fluviatilis]